MRKIVILLLLIFILITLTIGCSSNDEVADGVNNVDRDEVLTLRWGATGTGSSDDIQWISNGKIIEHISNSTDNMIQFEYYPSSQLGAESSMLDQVLMGTLDLCVVNPNTAATIWPNFTLMNYPFAYPDLNVFWDTWQHPDLVAALKNSVSVDGTAEYLGISTSTYRGCQNAKREIRSTEDMKGLVFRTMPGQIYVDLFEAMGASTASLSASEVFTGIQQGLVDGEETSPAFCFDNGYYEIEKYGTELNAMVSTAQIIVSSETWDKLTDVEKAIFEEACTTIPRELQVEFYNDTTDYYYEKLEETGMKITRWNDLTAEEQQSFPNAVMPLWDKYRSTVDEEFFNIWIKACSEAWEKNGYKWTYQP